MREGDVVDLKKWPTKIDPVYKSKKHYKKGLEEHVEQLSSLQRLLYASNRHAVLLIFQAMDAAGKDGAIRHVMSAARALIAHTTLGPAEICREAMAIAASLCVYTNSEIVIEEM